MKLFGKTSAATPTPRRRLSDDVVRERLALDADTAYRFQRNRTLTGSTSPRLGVAADHGDTSLVTPRQQSHQLRRRRRHLGLMLVSILAACGGIWWTMSQYIATPTIQLVSLPLVRDTGMYREAIDHYLAANPVERLLPLLNQPKLLATVQATHPEVKSLAITPGSFARPEIRLAIRQPVASWAVSGHDRYVDDSGVAFDINYYPTPPIQVLDQTGIRVDTNGVVASNRFLGFIGKLVGYARDMHYPLEKIVIPADTTHQIQGYVAGYDCPIKFSIDRPAGEQAEDMARTIEYLKLHTITPQYIDVRVDRRVFYRS